ncbi:uncharacterized protein FOMMEDRAFT_75480 [Fomitiporia mediterranea MF3/22]|uniref:uncharacterized protein n=1 Tax=Fomitiporia mediterranea (strain MF3/22) TaxID=694068 RepID=UPI000440845A|nr:uncharacterized protein FOMMEDRAFT_75480 [Fomitiporia mediterranea MF3/22]EJD06496.1 hypothetical protein FOMMEDRAFT_75480 [Fomitiporia mediterranea MF3/22]
MASPRRSPLILHASDISRLHTTLAFLAFGSALVIGTLLHYQKIVKNGVAGYPEEWFPSVSATIGDWYPERSIFHILIALNSGPRFAMVALQYFLLKSYQSSMPLVLLVTGIIRTLACGGWVYITSSDDHDAHDVLMITYMLCNIPWMLGGIACTPKQTRQRRRRFFLSIIPMIYFFIEHKVHRVPGGKSCNTAFSFVSDLYLAYLFWTIFTSLIPTLFYFSIWELGIAGAELALLSILSPGLLGIQSFRTWAGTKSGRLTLHVLALTGLVAYKLPTPAQRLLFVTFANFFLCIGASVDWSEPSTAGSQSIRTSRGLGLILSSLSKHANHSNNPLWPLLDEHTGGYNKTGIFLAVLAIFELALRDGHWKTSANSALRAEALDGPRSNSNVPLKAWLPSSLALGSLIFSLHCFLSDPSTLIAWTWTGYPIQGPVPHLHGLLTLIVQSAGMLLPILGSPVTSVLASPLWFLVGAVSSFVLYSYNDWAGYFGGLGVAVFFMSIIPQTLQQAAMSPFVGRTYFTAFFVAVVFYLASVWTVAYAFVPGGEVLRERTDLVLLAQILCLAPVFKWPGSRNFGHASLEVSPRFKLYTFNALCVMAAVSGLVTSYRMPVNPPQPHRPGHRMVRAGIWTVHFGLDNEGRDSQRLMRDLVRDMELDILGLLETDLHRHVYGNRDLTRVMAEDHGFYVDLGPGPDKHTWGAILLSKFPIINSTHHLLPSPHGELAPAISAFLDIYGTEVLVVIAHNGQEQDPLDRELQSTELARIMRSAYPAPAIFLGYVVTKPHADRPSPYKIMVEDGLMHDIDADDHDRWCEYILYRGLYRTSYLRMSRGKVTDTELQVGQFVVPRFGHSITDESESARYLRVHKEILEQQHWFPMEYYGDEGRGGKNGHYYHVFGTPLYYNLPEGAVL